MNIKVHIRWMIAADRPQVLDIARASFEKPWSEDDFMNVLKMRNCIGMIAEYDDSIVGYMIYELHKDRIELLTFCVSPDIRRHGVGQQMIAKIVGKLAAQRRNRIVLTVRETSLEAQLFFKACGFQASHVCREFYKDTNEDAYFMNYYISNELGVAK